MGTFEAYFFIFWCLELSKLIYSVKIIELNKSLGWWIKLKIKESVIKLIKVDCFLIDIYLLGI